MPERKVLFRQNPNIKFSNVQNKNSDIRSFRAFEHSNLEFVSNLAQASLRVVLRISNFIVLNKGFSFNH